MRCFARCRYGKLACTRTSASRLPHPQLLCLCVYSSRALACLLCPLPHLGLQLSVTAFFSLSLCGFLFPSERAHICDTHILSTHTETKNHTATLQNKQRKTNFARYTHTQARKHARALRLTAIRPVTGAKKGHAWLIRRCPTFRFLFGLKGGKGEGYVRAQVE